jgi:ATP-dependent Lon protease
MSNSTVSLPTSLPLLPLQHPLILFPASRVTLPVSRAIGEHILSLFSSSDSNPVVAAVPLLDAPSSPTKLNYNQWGVAARVVRLIKPTSRIIRQPYALSLHGLVRVKLSTPLPSPPSPQTPLKSLVGHPVTYLHSSGLPSPEAVEVFKASALRLLDRLAKDASQEGRREGWARIATMIDDVNEERVGWMADVMISAINGEYTDKLGKCLSPTLSHHNIDHFFEKHI